MKATGISLYRLVVPIVSIAAILAVSLFLFDEYYLPQANRKAGGAAQHHQGPPAADRLHPEQKWIFGQPAPASRAASSTTSSSIPTATSSPISRSSSSIPPPSRSRGASLPRAPSGTPQPAPGASRTAGSAISRAPPSPIIANSADLLLRDSRDPATSRRKSLQSQEMNFGQLDRYIGDLRQSGFDTMRLRVGAVAQARLPADRHRHGGAGHSLRALHGPARLAHRHRRGHRRGARLLCRRRPLWRHGQRQLPARRPGRLVLQIFSSG
jgi:hypothetical protein